MGDNSNFISVASTNGFLAISSFILPPDFHLNGKHYLVMHWILGTAGFINSKD
jgi:hypothetical protein